MPLILYAAVNGLSTKRKKYIEVSNSRFNNLFSTYLQFYNPVMLVEWKVSTAATKFSGYLLWIEELFAEKLHLN